MKDESKVILLESYSKNIFMAGQCENCKCFKIETDNPKWKNSKYHCIVKEGDSFCDYVKKSIDAIMVVENIKDMGEYIKIIKLKN
jgi:hypothetical protein